MYKAGLVSASDAVYPDDVMFRDTRR